MKTTLKLTTTLLMILSLSFCSEVKTEPKIERDKLQEIFDDQYNKVLYHSTMQIKHLYTNYPLSKKHLDSLLMSGYAMDVVHEKMKEK